MQFLNYWDLLLIKTTLAGLFVLYAGSKVQQALRAQKPARSISPHFITSIKLNASPSLAATRSLRKRLEQTGKRCIVFYGTQTGTAEKFALMMARELTARYNFPSMIADLDDYDFADLASMESNILAIFILATYGEGEPTDNAISFGSFLKQQNAQRGATGEKSMSSLRYAAFGLGSSSYQYFNHMITKADKTLQECGAIRVGSVGRGDDGKGTLETDFINWKEATLNDIASHFALEKVEYHFKPNFKVQEVSRCEISDAFLGEPNKNHLNGKICGPFTARNPYPARIVEARELFTSPQRNCLHLEFDVSDTTMTYETGDHLAIWPVNSDLEVGRFLKALNLFDKRDTIINITSNDSTTQVPIPPRTTYEAAARYYLDICAPVSRHALTILATLTAGQEQQALRRLANDSQLFQREISDKLLNFAQMLSMVGNNVGCPAVEFSFFLENIPKLQPRYYSISSSSLISSKKICVTAVVNSSTTTGLCTPFKGVSTNYLLAIKNEACGSLTESTTVPTHQLRGPRDKYHLPTALIHVRRSRFRLPTNPSIPVIMVGPGTGVAPFRGFVHERAYQARAGRNVGRTVLFYGCRKNDEDFLYKEEWESHFSSFKKGEFSLHTALSRDDPTKRVYVQDLVQNYADELKELILNQNAHVYVCGDASQMAKQVFKAFSDIIEGCVKGSSENYLKSMKASGRWSEDVW